MAKVEPGIRHDGFSNLLGSDSSLAPSLIPLDKCALAGNVFFRGGFATTRAGLDQLPLSYPTVEIAEWIENNILQGGQTYQPKFVTAYPVVSVGGRIFTIDLTNNFSVREITPTLLTTVDAFNAPAVGLTVAVTLADQSRVQVGYPITIAGKSYAVVSKATNVVIVRNVDATPGPVAGGSPVIILDPNSSINGTAWFTQGKVFLFIQDGQARCIIWDGAKAVRSDVTKRQVPTGTVMKYGKGRLWVAVNGDELVGSDLVRGGSGTAQYGFVDAILYFTENSLIANGGAFSLDLESGDITAMEFMPVLDTSTGVGPLIVFTEKAAFSINVPFLRSDWVLMTAPLQTIVLTGSGATSAYAAVAGSNSDIFFRAKDGLRSFVLAVREFVNSWGNTPISSELIRVLDKDDEVLLKYASAIQFQNRLWFTVEPQPLPGKEAGAFHSGFATLDFHPISNMRVKAPPAYDGIHAGIRPTLLFKGDIDGRERAFCWSLNMDNKNELWEISKDEPFDNRDGRPKCFLETRAMSFKDPDEMLKLMGAEIFVKDVKGKVDFKLSYWVDDDPCLHEWGRDQTVCTNWRECDTGSALCVTPINFKPGYKTRLNFGQPPDVDQEADDKPARLGYKFQFRIEWEGHCTLLRFIARAMEVTEQPFPPVN